MPAGSLRALALAAALAGSPAAQACGYHDPSTVNRGMLNLSYPNALYVGTAVWNAQQDGEIFRDERPVAAKLLVGFHQTVAKLGAFRDRLAAAMDGGASTTISMVLIGPLLWTRYEPTGATLTIKPHTDGPSDGDVVIVSDEPVIVSLIEGRVTPQLARELGLMRFYGSPTAVQDAISWVDRLSPLPNAKAADVNH